jgi:hypothetical protein
LAALGNNDHRVLAIAAALERALDGGRGREAAH